MTPGFPERLAGVWIIQILRADGPFASPGAEAKAGMEIFVSNLAYQVQDTELRDLFTPFGEVRRASVVKDRETGQSRGFGFVDMPDADSGRRAIAELNGLAFQSRPLMVSEARAREPGARPAGPGTGGGGGSYAPRPYSPRPPSPGGGGGGYAPRPYSSRPPSSSGYGSGSSGAPPPPEAQFVEPLANERFGPDAREIARRTQRNNAGVTSKDKRKADPDEARRRNALKNAEKGRRLNPRLNPDDDEEADILPVRIR